MKNKLVFGSAIAFFSSASMVFATTVSFDDLSAGSGGSGNYPQIANGYSGLNWDNFFAIDGSDTVGNGEHAGTISAKNVAFNGFGDIATITGTSFNLVSGYFTSVWNDNLKLEIKGYISGSLAFDTTYILSAVTATLINFDYVGVDKVTFESSGGTHHGEYTTGSGSQFAVDDLDYTRGAVSLPENQSTALAFGSALAVLGAAESFNRRKRFAEALPLRAEWKLAPLRLPR